MPTLIQSISRCMAVLEFLNLRNGATIADLCAQTGLTRGTAYRILETLRQEGFLRKDVGSAHYWLAGRVRSLSDGYQDEGWIDAYARPIMVALGEQTRWPVKLLTPSGQDMLTRVTTDFSSPFTDGKYPTGLRISMLWSAAGRAFLAFCSDGDRQLLKTMAAADGRVGLQARRAARGGGDGRGDGYAIVDTSRPEGHSGIPPDLDVALAEIRADGYAVVHTAGALFFTLAVPVLVGETAVGAIALHVFRSVMRPPEAVAAYLRPLRAAAQKIADRFGQG